MFGSVSCVHETRRQDKQDYLGRKCGKVGSGKEGEGKLETAWIFLETASVSALLSFRVFVAACVPGGRNGDGDDGEEEGEREDDGLVGSKNVSTCFGGKAWRACLLALLACFACLLYLLVLSSSFFALVGLCL